MWWPVEHRLRPWLRRGAGALAAVAVLFTPTLGPRLPAVPASAPPPPFDAWVAALMDDAERQGFDRALIDRTLAGVRPLPMVLQLDRAQAQAPPRLDAYLDERLPPALIERGRDALREHRPLLARIERAFAVDRRFVIALWGAETGYGSYTGHLPVFATLATLAWDPRRARYFRRELFAALRIAERGWIDDGSMLGSWAGAMGQPQFMPTSYLDYAVDFDRDGRRDIWTSTADTLASIGNYLQTFGWNPGEGWGREVALSPAARARAAAVPARTAGCGAVRALSEPRALSRWDEIGVRGPDGSRLRRIEVPASLITIEGRSFLVSRNYETVLAYNCSHRYALSVSLLADRIDDAGRAPDLGIP